MRNLRSLAKINGRVMAVGTNENTVVGRWVVVIVVVVVSVQLIIQTNSAELSVVGQYNFSWNIIFG